MSEGVVLAHRLPELREAYTKNEQSRYGAAPRLVVVHRWGAPLAPSEAERYASVISWFKNPVSEVSAHLVYPGSAVPGEATQLVRWSRAAWAEKAYNRYSVEVESADAIWLGNDPAGFHQLAHIVAWLCHHFKIPARALDPSTAPSGHGFCRHADLGVPGGDHPSCPTTDVHLWAAFAGLVRSEYQRGGFRPSWGKP